jgi:hypothetical protein
MFHRCKPAKPRRGIVVILVAISLVALIGILAIAVDGGLLFMVLREARATADASAMAGACVLFEEYPTNAGVDRWGHAATAAQTVATNNGYPNDNTTAQVTINIPPQSGAYTGKPGYVEVIVTKFVSRGFSRIFGSDVMPVRARAVARGTWVAGNAGVIILDYNDKASLNSQGNGAFTETGGPVIIKSNNPSAVVTTGNGSLVAPEFDVTGGVQLGGNAVFQTAPTAGQIYLGTHPTPDPLAYLPVPSVPDDGTMTTLSLGQGNTLYTLSPGRYSNLPTFSTGDVVMLKQASANDAGGIYYIDGGGFKSTGATIMMDPTTSGGVMIYNKPQGAADSQKIQITGDANGTVNLSPLTDGPSAGMVLWQDRTSSVDVLVEGNGNFNVSGTFYTAGARLNINGNAKSSTGTSSGFYYDDQGNPINGASRIGSQFVTNNLSLGGNGNISIKYVGPKVARTRILTLVE